MAKKHYSKAELMYMLKDAKNIRQTAETSVETGISTLCNYVLWIEEKVSDTRIEDYNALVREYYKIMQGHDKEGRDKQVKVMQQRLYEYIDETVEQRVFDESMLDKKSPTYYIEKKNLESNNVINEWSVIHLLIHFNALMDFGYSKKRLQTNFRIVQKYLERMNDDDFSIMDLHKELKESGIVIEMPKL